MARSDATGPSWQVGVGIRAGTPVGGGVYLGNRWVLTCAHVLGDAPPATASVQFPFLGEATVDATVAPDGWRAGAPGRSGDVALLELASDPPRGARPAPLRDPAAVRRHGFLAYGYPKGHSGPVLSDGFVEGVVEYGWLQLTDPDAGHVIEEGFSGTPLWDDELGAVIGIVVARDKDSTVRGGFAIPLRVITDVLPQVSPFVRWRITDEHDFSKHWSPRSRGVEHERTPGSHFTGRTHAIRQLVSWLHDDSGRQPLQVVTGRPGSGKSAVLARLVRLADPFLRSELSPEASGQLERDGVLPRVGAVSAAVNAEHSDLTTVTRRLGKALALVCDDVEALLDRVAEWPEPLAFVVDSLDRAAEGEAARLVERLVVPLVSGGVRVLVASRRERLDPLLRNLAVEPLDLDDPPYFDRSEVEAYVAAVLRATGRDTPSPYRDDPGATAAVSRVIARYADRNFSVAQLLARARADAPAVVDTSSPGWERSVVDESETKLAIARGAGYFHGRRRSGIRPQVDLVDRTDEQDLLRDLVTKVAAGSTSTLVLLGEAGQGKSSLVAWVAGLAAASGFTVLAATGAEFEWGVPYSGLTAVLEPVAGKIGSLPDVQARAVRGAIGLGEPAGTEQLPVHLGTLGLLIAESDMAPVLVVVDDAHWLDLSSLHSLAFAAHQCDQDRVGFVFAQRSGRETMLDRTRFRRCEVGGLGRDGAVQLLHGEGVDPDVAARCWEMTNGNPLALLEAARTLTPGQRVGTEALPAVLPVSDHLVSRFAVELDTLSAPVRQALAVAALDSQDDAFVVMRALTTLGGTIDDLTAAERSGVITLAGGRIEWRHPLFRAAVHRTLAAGAARRAHGALAAAAAGDGPELRWLWHLAESVFGHDARVATRLAEAAERAVARGARNEAADAFDAAARLSTSPDERARYVLKAADALLGAGELERVVTNLTGTIDGVVDPVIRAEMAVLLGDAEPWIVGPARAGRRLERHAAAVANVSPTLAATLELRAVGPCLFRLDPAGALRMARRAHHTAQQSHDPLVKVGAWATLVITTVLDGGGAAAEEDLARVGQAARGALDNDFAGADLVAQSWAIATMLCEEWAVVEETLHAVIDSGERSGMPGRTFFAEIVMADVLWRTGRWVECRANLTQAIAMQEATALGYVTPFSYAVLARVEAGMGMAEPCRAHVDEAMRAASPLGIELVRAWALSSAGLLALGLGRHAEAAGVFADLDRIAGGLAEPGWLWWQADAIEALAGSGDEVAARGMLDRLERQAVATGRAWAMAAVERCSALLDARGPADQRLTAALDRFTRLGAPFEQGRTLLARGEHRIEHGRAREGAADLAAARAVFDRLGAAPWSARASRRRGEVSAAHSSLAAQLTPAELSVALAVGTGKLRNREAAERLHVSVKTVDFHLQNIYRKLGLRSRSELVARVASAQPGA